MSCWKQIIVTALLVFTLTLFIFFSLNGSESPYNNKAKYTAAAPYHIPVVNDGDSDGLYDGDGGLYK